MAVKPLRKSKSVPSFIHPHYSNLRSAVAATQKAFSSTATPRKRPVFSNPSQLLSTTNQVRRAYEYLLSIRELSRVKAISSEQRRIFERDWKPTVKAYAELRRLQKLRQTHDIKFEKALNDAEFIGKVYDGLRSRKPSQQLSFAMIDKDFFGQVNKKFGHNVGDFVIRTFTEVFAPIAKREGIVFGRFGGDEFKVFGLISPERMSLVLQQVAKKYYSIVRNPVAFGVKPNKTWDGWRVPTLSVGISGVKNLPKKKVPLDKQFDSLDRAARIAQQFVKDHGRNGIKIAD